MKKLLVVLMVLSIATVANAGLQIGLNGVTGDHGATLAPAGTVTISIVSDGLTTSADTYVLMLDSPQGATMVDLDNATDAVNANTPAGTSVMYLMGDPTTGGVFMDFSIVAVPIPNLPSGVIADQMILSYDTVVGVGNVTLTLWGDDTNTLFDTQVISQVPEPMTMGLLGLGGLFLRRRSK